MTFGQRLRELRKAKGITQRELANKVGISFTYISKIENISAPPPREEVIVALAYALDVDADELLGLAKKVPFELLAQIEQLEFFRELIESSKEVIIVLNQDIELLYESPFAAHLLGYEEEKLIGRDPLGFVHPDDISRVASILTELAQTPGETKSIWGRIKHRDGTWRVLEGIAHSLVHIPAVKGIVISVRDITERGREVEKVLGGDTPATVTGDYHLTDSEMQVLTLMAEGQSNLQIAERLVLSSSTVRFHVSNILRKLDVASRTEAVALAMRHRLVT